MTIMPEITIPNLTDTQKTHIEILRNITSLNTGLNDVQTDVRELNKIVIVGNGELALRERIRNLEAFINNIKFWLRTVAIALVAQTVTFGIAAIVYFIKLYPLLNKLTEQVK
jgi:hypothetical protein